MISRRVLRFGQAAYWQIALLLGLVGSAAAAMPAAPDGVVETGVPSFVIMGPEALGLSTAPTDIHVLPDGRILVVSQQELAFGDGVRWETMRGEKDQPNLLAQVAVDDVGQIYAGTLNGLARIDLKQGAHWQFTRVGTLTDGGREQLPGKVAMLADRWYWFGGSDAVYSWKPGEKLRFSGRFGTIDRIFVLKDDAYLSDQSSGRLYRLKPDGTSEPADGGENVVSESITCAVPFEEGELLVGTVSAGLKLFDGKTFRPFGPERSLIAGRRVTDLCLIGENYVAAAVDNVGIVFMDREGRTVQVLGRSLDHRLARVLRLTYASTGVLWALLNEGVARVEFPSPVSRYEPILGGGLSYARPLRHAGELWIMADGRAVRGQYDATGRLEGFTDDTPPGRYLFTLSEIDGVLFGCSDAGIYIYKSSGWKEILPGIINARLGLAHSDSGELFYAARGEYGVIERVGDDYSARRIPLPELGDNYGAAVDDAGIGWLELGVGLVGRFDASGAEPKLELLGADAGLARDWVEIWILDGLARFHLSNLHYRFDNAQHRFVDDSDLFIRYPHLANAGGRPVMDHFGRLWFTADGAPRAIDYRAPGGERPLSIPPMEFFPTSYTVEEDGVVWMSDRRRLARVDLRIPAPPEVPLRALITSVQVLATGRQLFSPVTAMDPLSYNENSLIIHFAAPANPFASPVSFEVLLEGSGTQWVSMGAVGSATFHRLKEGSYAFRVRPVAGRTKRGAEARLVFSVRPPWYRTTLAWVLYVCSAAGLVGFAAWLSSYLQRRENARLEHLVTERTSALSASEEHVRSLNAGLEQRVEERTAELLHSNRELQQRESLFRLVFEHAPVGISWKRADLGDTFHLNPTFRRILGLSADELMDHTLLRMLVHPNDVARQNAMTGSIESGACDSFNIEERFILADGRVMWGSLSIAVVRDPAGGIVQEIGILEDITPRKRAEEQLAATYKNLLAASRIAGMAEVATSVLHNVGNVLNSLNVSSNLLADANKQSRTDLLLKLSALLNEHAADLGTFLSADPKGRLVPGLLQKLADHAVEEQKSFAVEIASMQENIDYIKEIVALQRSHTTTVGVVETLDASALVEQALRITRPALSRHGIKIVTDFSPVPPLTVEKDKALEILINVIHNAGNACSDAPAEPSHEKLITVIVEPAPQERLRIIVRDNGVGIALENLTRIFAHGFTTRAEGRGFALHASSLAASEMQGSLTASSEGLGNGASFTLELPITPAASGRFSGFSAFPEPSPYAASISSGGSDPALAADPGGSR